MRSNTFTAETQRTPRWRREFQTRVSRQAGDSLPTLKLLFRISGSASRKILPLGDRASVSIVMAIDRITVRGARQHNLKNVDVDIPRNKLTVITGLSGSGKSSLAFDTIYAEGQRRYVESLSAYARQFLDRLEPPDV